MSDEFNAGELEEKIASQKITKAAVVTVLKIALRKYGLKVPHPEPSAVRNQCALCRRTSEQCVTCTGCGVQQCWMCANLLEQSLCGFATVATNN